MGCFLDFLSFFLPFKIVFLLECLMEVRKLAAYQGHQGAVYGLTSYAESPLFYSGGGDGWLVAWHKPPSESTDGRPIAQVDGAIFSSCLLFPNLLAAGTISGGLYIVDIDERKAILKNQAHHKGIFCIREHQGKLYTLGGDGYLRRSSSQGFVLEESLHLTNTNLRAIDMHLRFR
jgi:hypothetical protein